MPLKNNDRAAGWNHTALLTTRAEIFAHFNQLRAQRELTQNAISIAAASHSPNKTLQPHNRQVDQQHRQHNAQQAMPLRNNDPASLIAAAFLSPTAMTTQNEIFAHFNQLRAQRELTRSAIKPPKR